jgi:hypothetical protein
MLTSAPQTTANLQPDDLGVPRTPMLKRSSRGRDRSPSWPPSLDQLIEAERVRRTGDGTSTSADYDRLRARYENAHGEIVDLYVCKNVEGAGAVLTSTNEIKVRYPADQVAALQPGFEEALWRATALSREARQLLVGRQAKILSAMIQSVVVYLLGVLDSQHRSLPAAGDQTADSPPARIEESLATARKELGRIRECLRRSAEVTAQRFYLYGMLIGLPALLLTALSVARVDMTGVPVAPLVVTVLGGGVGALISVMTRITSGNLTLDRHAGRGVLTLAGAFRPLIGGVLGLVLYVIIQAGLVPVAIPAGPKDMYLFSAIAFLAGFSERFAQDMLTKTSGGLAPPAEEPTAGGTTASGTSVQATPSRGATAVEAPTRDAA